MKLEFWSLVGGGKYRCVDIIGLNNDILVENFYYMILVNFFSIDPVFIEKETEEESRVAKVSQES